VTVPNLVAAEKIHITQWKNHRRPLFAQFTG